MPNLALISAQKSLGDGLTADFLKTKAARDLDRSMSDGQYFLDHATSFAVTISHIMDWVYYLEVAMYPQWNGMKCDDFRKWTVDRHEGVSVFLDIANEFKHASRKSGASKLLTKLDFDLIEEKIAGSATPSLIQYSIGSFTQLDLASGKKSFVVPMIRSATSDHFYKQIADDSLSWWWSFNPQATTP